MIRMIGHFPVGKGVLDLPGPLCFLLQGIESREAFQPAPQLGLDDFEGPIPLYGMQMRKG